MENIQNNGEFVFLINQKENIEKIEKDHHKIIDFIKDVKENKKKEIFVPVCENYAFFIGKIKNPNECKVYLGEDYFVKTTCEKAIKILDNRVSKTRGLLKNLNREIFNEKSKQNPKSIVDPNLKNLKKLHDDTYEIVEEFDEDETQNVDNKGKVSNRKEKSNEEERKKLIDEKLNKIKAFNGTDESSIVLSVVKRKSNLTSVLEKTPNKCVNSNNDDNSNKKDINPSKKKKKDTIMPDINSSATEYQTDSYNKRSYFYDEDDN